MKVDVVTIIFIIHWPLSLFFGCKQPLAKLPAATATNSTFLLLCTNPLQINTTNTQTPKRYKIAKHALLSHSVSSWILLSLWGQLQCHQIDPFFQPSKNGNCNIQKWQWTRGNNDNFHLQHPLPFILNHLINEGG